VTAFGYTTFFSKKENSAKKTAAPSGSNYEHSSNLHSITASCELIWNQGRTNRAEVFVSHEKLFSESPRMEIRIVQINGFLQRRTRMADSENRRNLDKPHGRKRSASTNGVLRN
jgi:hypothetical protein